ncbi:MAG: transcriptional regulator [Blastocatellia bacterium]|nr:transcriptional regulator [Blastocatellia bacterium]
MTKNAKKRASKSFNERAYGRLLARELPARITNSAEYERAYEVFRKLRDKGDAKTPEEARYQELLGALIDDRDNKAMEEFRRLAGPEPTPVEMLKFFMEENGLKQSDLLFAFGAQSTVSNVLRGKRAITAAQAKKLGARFRVRADLFI